MLSLQQSFTKSESDRDNNHGELNDYENEGDEMSENESKHPYYLPPFSYLNYSRSRKLSASDTRS